MVKLSVSTICTLGLGLTVRLVRAEIDPDVKGIQFQGSHYVFSLTDYGVCREYNQDKWNDINKYELPGMHCYNTPDALEYNLCVFRKQDTKSPCALQEAQCHAIDGVLDPGKFCSVPLPSATTTPEPQKQMPPTPSADTKIAANIGEGKQPGALPLGFS